jgi:hypothetical protein
MTPDIIPPLLSVAALLASCATAWLSLFRRGKLKMTRPAVVYFGAEAHSSLERVLSQRFLFEPCSTAQGNAGA